MAPVAGQDVKIIRNNCVSRVKGATFHVQVRLLSETNVRRRRACAVRARLVRRFLPRPVAHSAVTLMPLLSRALSITLGDEFKRGNYGKYQRNSLPNRRKR